MASTPNKALHRTANAMHLCAAGRYAPIFAQMCIALSARERGVQAVEKLEHFFRRLVFRAESALKCFSPCESGTEFA